jgi:hypothetical protein
MLCEQPEGLLSTSCPAVDLGLHELRRDVQVLSKRVGSNKARMTTFSFST